MDNIVDTADTVSTTVEAVTFAMRHPRLFVAGCVTVGAVAGVATCYGVYRWYLNRMVEQVVPAMETLVAADIT